MGVKLYPSYVWTSKRSVPHLAALVFPATNLSTQADPFGHWTPPRQIQFCPAMDQLKICAKARARQAQVVVKWQLNRFSMRLLSSLLWEFEVGEITGGEFPIDV